MAIFSSLETCFLLLLLTIVHRSTSSSEKRQELFDKALEGFRMTDSDTIVHMHKPVRTTRSGQFVEFATLDALSHVSGDGKVRRRRNVSTRNVRDRLDAAAATEDGNHEIFFDLGHSTGSPLSGARLHLKRNYKLVSQNFVVEERSRGGKIIQRHNLLEECHYSGVIHNHDSFSKVALSVCNGLQGIIFKDEHTYFIEPVWNHTTSKQSANYSSSTSNETDNESHPHVIIKRSALQHLNSRRKSKDDLGHCGYSDEVDGDTPWWRIDPRKSKLSNSNDDKSEASEGNLDVQGEKTFSKYHRNHHHDRKPNHRTDSGRSASIGSSSEEILSRKRRNALNGGRVGKMEHPSSVERNVETLVVADKMLVGYHGRSEVEKYILTIMNIVASLYHDASIGNAVNIIVTRIVLLTEDQPNLEISHHADRSMVSFCKWQNAININGSSGSSDSGLAHHDNAVLLTGFDICTGKDEPCGTLGLAPVAGMCEPDRSCNINEDTGLSSAFTIAHEIGHNFAMQHDGTGNSCGPDSGTGPLIMARQLTKNASPFSWSVCSKKYITSFLDSGAGTCLLDQPPIRDFAFPEEMPGQMHDAEEQCRFQYGPQSRQCKIGNICQELWCLTKNGHCVTNSVPAAEGTSCTTESISRGWCYRRECVAFGYRAEALDGDWGQWTRWDECSRSCGGGISSSSRVCNNPAPEHGGKYCIGERIRRRICNTQACPSTTDFRHEQCARFDTEPFRGKYYNWVPFEGGDDTKPCALNCRAEGYYFYTERASAVIDGTRCFAKSLDTCISGECHHVGCDNVLHSDAVEDKCRVCGGDGSTCQTESGVFNENVIHGQYHDVVMIPRGSVNILLEELEVSSQNYIGIRSAQGMNYINGGWTILWPQKMEIAGTTFDYQRPPGEIEVLQALGPTNEDLIVMVLLQEPNQGIKFEYNVPIDRESSGEVESAFLWDHDEWTPCSASCAGGSQRRPVVCRRADDDTIVRSSYCNPSTKLVEREQTCNLEPCPALWSPELWSECSKTCGGGHRTRTVVCIRKMTQTEDEIVNNRYCTDRKPRSSERCNTKTCPAVWRPEPWSSCSPSCGVGYKTREVSCVSSDRKVRFRNESMCDQRLKPSTRVRCSKRACPRPVWKQYKWSRCSAECGQGTKRRRVICVYHRTNRQSHLCSSSNKPASIASCQGTCSRSSVKSTSGQCEDDTKVSYCPLVRKFKFCNRPYFRTKCCRTCSR